MRTGVAILFQWYFLLYRGSLGFRSPFIMNKCTYGSDDLVITLKLRDVNTITQNLCI